MQSLADVESKIASAEERGLTKGITQSLLTVLTAKFGELPDEVRTRVEGANCEQLEEWMDRVFAAEGTEDIFREAPDN
ncbi:MAG: transposase [Candidatus Electrothrix sp. LOE1_4_5]|nr:transposase [Candidatus Electrothrix gigas]